MKVRVLFFGATADLVGNRELTLTCADTGTADDILHLILKDFPQLQDQKLLLSINQEYAYGFESVREGDEMAIFTAVSGG
ncbi:MAG: MoaD/ThiS family protein [Pyrinomonadaceae bacterium]